MRDQTGSGCTCKKMLHLEEELGDTCHLLNGTSMAQEAEQRL